jgi:hypothetical protein
MKTMRRFKKNKRGHIFLIFPDMAGLSYNATTNRPLCVASRAKHSIADVTVQESSMPHTVKAKAPPFLLDAIG